MAGKKNQNMTDNNKGQGTKASDFDKDVSNRDISSDRSGSDRSGTKRSNVESSESLNREKGADRATDVEDRDIDTDR